MRATNFKIKIFVIMFILIFLWQISKLWSIYSERPDNLSRILAEQQKNQQQILVTVYYEALCPDSRSFIIKQLVPTYDIIEDYIELQLIPYGKAETILTDDDYSFKCQHGETECEANIVHACSINKIRDSRKQLELVACMIKNNIHPIPILKNCGSDLDEYRDILNCSVSIEGRRLLMKFGGVTSELDPKVSFIPTITLDNEMDNQIMILKNLMRQVCQRLDSPPKACRS